MGHRAPFDQVKIDGLGLSSLRQRVLVDGEASVSLGWCGAHLGLIGDNWMVGIGSRVSEMLDDVVGEVNEAAASI
jgi:hypothetical protein